jgi:hypothetical protein
MLKPNTPHLGSSAESNKNRQHVLKTWKLAGSARYVSKQAATV